MSVTIPELRIGDPVSFEAITVFPLFADPPEHEVEYRLADEALAEKSLAVEEVSEAGSVPYLLVKNSGDVRVLFLEAEELIGAKQNRILNSSILVAAHSQTKVPVSCVEQGRWRYATKSFASSGSMSPSVIQAALKQSVTQSLKSNRGYSSDQVRVWKEVAGLHACLGVASRTGAMKDAFQNYQTKVQEYQDRIHYVARATGMAVGVGNRIISIGLFDKPETCQKVWPRVLSGYILESIAVANQKQEAPTEADVVRLLQTLADATWQLSEPVGEGEDYRTESHNEHASALVLHDTLVHCSLVTAA